MLHDFLEAGVGNCRLVVDLVVCASVFCRLQESSGAGHLAE